MRTVLVVASLVLASGCLSRVEEAGAGASANEADKSGALDACDVVGPAFSCASCQAAGHDVDVASLDVAALPELPVAAADGARTLLFSDSP